MPEMFHLGFEIDTRPLAQTAVEATKAADATAKLGDAERRLAAEAQKTAAAQKQVADETQKASRVTNDAANAHQTGRKSAAEYEEAIRRVSGNLRVSQQDTQNLISALRGQQGLAGSLDGAAGMLGRVGAAIGPVGIALGATAIAGGVAYASFKKLATPLAEAQDQMALFDARLRNALGSSSAAKSVMSDLYDSTQKTGLGFRDTADAFLRVARNAESLGATKEQVKTLTDTVQKLGAVSGASKGEIGSGMLQLSQALASGRLNGDELRSIMENMPALAKAISENLGVSVGQLRAMGAAGELSSEKVFQALLKASNKANEEFAKLPDTVERANQRTADSWDQLLATLGKKWNASKFVVDATNFLNRLVNEANQKLQPAGIGDQIDALQQQRANYQRMGGRNSEREIEKIDGQIKRLQQQAQAELGEASKANADKEKEIAFAPIKRAAELGANEYDDYTKKIKKAKEETGVLEDAIGRIETRLKTGLATDDDKALLPSLRRQLSNAKVELSDLAGVLEKAKRDLSDARLADSLGGGGGGTSIVAAAQKQFLEARAKGGGSLQQFIDIGVQNAAIKAQDQVEALGRQAAAQEKLAQSVGKTRAEVVDFEVANEVAQKRLDLFGKLTAPAITKVLQEYEAALRRSKGAADDLANAQARLGLRDQIAAAQAALDNVGNPYAGRAAANALQAAAAGRRDPEQAALIRQQFGIQEQTNAANLIDASRRNAAFNRSVIGMDAGALRDAELNRRIADAQRGVRPEDRDALGAAMREEAETQRTREYAQQEKALERQMRLLEERQRLVGLMPEEQRVQNALLEKRNALEAAGAPEEVIARQLRLTELIERQTIAFEKQNRPILAIQGAFERLGSGIESAFRDSIEKGLGEGTKAGIRQFSFSFRTAIRKLGSDLTYEIGIRPFVEMMKNMAVALGNRLVRALLGPTTGGGGFGTGSAYGNQDLGLYLANGGAFGPGGVRTFASGGAFTNSIVSSPTLFAFAGGGALGLMGEAGPEAVMPLKRGRDGSLGVVGGGGGDVQVVINDMRANTEAPQIRVAESRGPDNRRILQVMVRDEVRRAVRSGELDTEMYSNFGVARSVARK